ncbi:phytanoyl-CoA dioxygenase family protein [Collimonas sp. PA-H2]|uniref:phytanoyl-CoA dioxygenase family protein n=1 Tax=Collimonas sp. PA-H2 TaxID=1881062 RepID=UPI0013043D50|nr:phytanoyl-CoA dioxygenase family protein [Collimonas sp. PA-H2]
MKSAKPDNIACSAFDNIGMTANKLDDDGFLITGPLFGHELGPRLENIIPQLKQDSIGSRNLMEHSWCVDLAKLIRGHQRIAPFLSAAAVAVQCNLFEKSKNQNWLVPVHQDLGIAVREKIKHPALTGWTEKEGSIFVQPPDSFLHEMVAVRFHIDECGLDDGPLRVVRASHKAGRLDSHAALAERDRVGETLCAVERGGAMLMKPLLLHASSKASGHSRRRVLHFVFAPPVLPFGLQWRHAF